MPGQFRVNAMGAPVEVVCDDSVPDAVVAQLRDLWQELPDQRRLPVNRLTCAIHPSPKPCIQLVAGSAQELIAALTTHLTFRGLAHNRGRCVMLHAAAIALPDGRVLALVGPSGRGKTTAVRTLGRHHGYVTDEALVVLPDPDHLVVRPFRKPLSLVQHGGPKRQADARELGLQPLPQGPLRLAGVALLDRVAPVPGQDRAPVTIERVGLVEAFEQLAPQLSYLAELDDPLVALAGVIEATGGLRRVSYGEAGDLLAVVEQLVSPTTPAARTWPSGRTTDPAASSGSCWQASPRVAWLDLGEAVVTLLGDRVQSLGGIAPALWRRLLGGTASFQELLVAAVAEFGAPPVGSPEAPVRAALTDLARLRLVHPPAV